MICDDRRHILLLNAQYPGSVHDARAFRALELNTSNPSSLLRYFGGNRYLIGDSAYKLTNQMVTPFKKPFRGQLSASKKAFNKQLSKLRIRIEHTIGILKARFGCLRCLPNPPRLNKNTMQWCYAWIVACAILHNILLEYNDPWRPSNEQQAEIRREEQDILYTEAVARAQREGVYVSELEEDTLMDEGLRREGVYNEFLREHG